MLAFSQRALLFDALASRGVTARQVVIADDRNLLIAEAHGFDVIDMENEPVAAKINAGFEYAARQGADYMTFVGSDDWLHIDLFQPLIDSDVSRNEVFSGREITLVDLSRSVMTRMRSTSLHGMIPWIFPTALLAGCAYRPMPAHLNQGLDYPLYYQLREAKWIFHDPHPHLRVDLKSDTNITPYSRIGRVVGNSPEVHINELRQWYPHELVDLAEEFA